MFGLFKNEELHIEIRPACPKCKKEFMLDLKKFLPGKTHRCFACGTVASFDPSLAERIQKQIADLETSIRELHQNFSDKV
ncbi:MAG TPA: hypothetical protein DCR97_05740 [Deltaproteobacteria bacterium]|nr:hypothetical protein [Deltaproteobacteria bacterium]